MFGVPWDPSTKTRRGLLGAEIGPVRSPKSSMKKTLRIASLAGPQEGMIHLGDEILDLCIYIYIYDTIIEPNVYIPNVFT